MTTANDQLITELRLLRRTIANAALFVGCNLNHLGRTDVEVRLITKAINALAEVALITTDETS